MKNEEQSWNSLVNETHKDTRKYTLKPKYSQVFYHFYMKSLIIGRIIYFMLNDKVNFGMVFEIFFE